ncbi:MAG TPA: 2-hydroxy-3-oxopropionate reductase [Nitrosomonas halophila]|nr:2-hydroxy-3-oxopropionate reductase [Nitrosomonas halophila]
MKEIGFIGLGIMGKPMARHLIENGYTVYLNSRSGVPDELIALGGRACPAPQDVAEKSEIIFLMLPDTAHVETVLFAKSGIVEGLLADRSRPRIIVDMSSISPIQTWTFAERLLELGHHYADAPVSGGEIGAQNATLTIMVGATEAIFETIKPALAVMGQTITRTGDPGAGQICKVANQIVVALTLEAVAEALVFASKAGADPEKVRQALLGGFAASRILEVHGERMIKHAFDPGFRIDLQVKDLGIALASASALGVSLPGTALAQSLYNACMAQGDARLDNSAIVRILEKLAEHDLTQPTPCNVPD